MYTYMYMYNNIDNKVSPALVFPPAFLHVNDFKSSPYKVSA